MRKLYCLAIGFFLLTVSAENEDLQGYLTEQTKGTTVTKDLFLNKGNTIRHGTEAIPTEKTHPVSAVTVTGKFPAAVLYDSRPTAPHKGTQITKGLAANASPNSEPFRNGHNSLKPTRGNPLAIGIHTESEMPLIFNYDKIVFSPTQAAFESMMNGTSEPEVHLTANAVKVSFSLHTLLDNRNQRKTDSITITSADRGPGVPILSASHPRVIDNLAARHNDNDDKRSQGRDEKGISNLGRKENPFGTMRSVLQSAPTKDSVRGDTVANFCLTCLKGRRAVTPTKSVALPAPSLDSSDSLSTEGITSRFNQVVTPFVSLHQQSAREQEEIQNKGINHQNITKNSSFGLTEQLVLNLTFPHLSLNKNVNHSQSILNKSHVKSFLSDTGTVAFDTQPLAEMSSVTQKDTKKPGRHTYLSETSPTERPISTTRVLYRSSKSLYTVRKPEKNGKQEMFGEKVSIGDPQSKLIYFSENNQKSSHTLFQNVFIHHQPLDFNSVSASDMPITAEAAHRSQKNVLPKGTDHSAALHPTVRMKLIEAHSMVSSPSISRPTTVAVRNPESHSLPGAGSLIFPIRSQTPLQPSSQTKQPTLTLFIKDSTIKFASVTPKGHLTDEQSQTFSSVNGIAKQSFVDPLGPASKPAMEESQTPTIATRKVGPAKFFHSDSRQDFGKDVVTFTSTTLSSKSSSERPTLSESEMTQDRTSDVSNDNHVAPTLRSSVKYNRDLITESLKVHNLKPGDNKQVLTVAAKDENKEIIKTEGKQGEEIRVIKETLKLQEEEESREDEKLGNKREELFRSDKNESRKQDSIIKSGVEMNQNTGPEEHETNEHKAKTSREEGGETVGEEGVTLGQNKEEVTHEEGADADEKQTAESLMKKGAEARREETVCKEDIKHNRGIGSEDMTNVPPGPTANSKELSRDKGHPVTNPSLCHTLIKQLGVTQQRGIHLGENTARIAEMKNKEFFYGVTSRPLHLTLRPQSPKPSRMRPFPKELYPQIKPHPSAHSAMLTQRGATASPTEESTRNKVVRATFSVTDAPKMAPELSRTLGVSTSKLSRASKPTISLHSSATKSAHPVLNSISNMMSLTTPRMAITAGFQQAQPHFTVNSSSLRVSIIYSASDHRNKFTTSVSTANSLLQTADEREQTEHIIPAHIFESSVKKPLTSNMIEEVNISTSLNPGLSQQMYNDSSTRPPTAAVLSTEAHISIGQLQPHQGQSAPQISQFSSPSFDMTSGQKHSFKLSEQTAHSDALHAPVDDNEQRSVQTLMASMSPEAKSDQSPLSSMSPLLNLMLLGGDSLPGTYSMTGLTRSASEKEILRAKPDTEYANSGSGPAASLLGTADGTNQTEDGDSEQKTMTLTVKRSDVVAKQMAENSGEKNNPPFTVQTTGRTEKPAVKTIKGNNNDLFSIDGDDEANSTAKTTRENNHLSQLESYNEASTKPTVFAIQATHYIEQAINEDSVPVTNGFIIPVLDTDYQTDSTAFVESGSLAEKPKMQANDVPRNAVSDEKSLVTQTAEKQYDPSTPRESVGDRALPAPHIHFRSEVKVPTQLTADWTMNVTSAFQVTTPKTNDIVPLGSAFRTGSRSVATKAHESVRTTSKSAQTVIEKSSRVEHAERTAQPNRHTEPLSLREPPATRTTGKLPPAVKEKNTTETQSVEQPEHEISGQDIEQSQHAPPGMIAIPHPINDPGQRTGSLKVVNNAKGEHDTTPTTAVEYSLLKDIKTAVTTKSAFEAKLPPHERTPAEHILSTADQHEKHALLEKTSISQVILGVVTDLFPRTAILPTEIIKKSSCGTIGCAKSGKTIETTIGAGEIDHTAPEKMYEAQDGIMERVHFDAAHTHGNCSTDCSASGKATKKATNPDYAALSPANNISDHDHATETATKNAKRVTYEISAQTRRVLVDTAHLEGGGTLEQAQFAEKTIQRQSHRESSAAIAAEVTLSEPEETTAQTTVKTTEQTPLAGKKTKTQLNRGAAKAEISEAQNATRSARAVSKGETVLRESGRSLLLPELPKLEHMRRTSPHLYLSGVTEVSDDLCGSGNYTAEMSLNVGRGVEPGDAVPAMGNLRVIINLKTNNSRLNLQVTSCCLSPTIQPELANSTCCLFSRLAAEPAGITLLPSTLSTSASFTISLFQMINYSVVYLHCDLSVCLRNRSDCERQCLQQRSTFSSEGPETVVTNLKNRISFGPMLKEVRNSTFPEEMDPSELDLVLVIVGLVVGSSLVTVTLLLVWLAYRRRAIWLLHTAAPPRACCGCLHPGGDLILP